jgi:hypothetical protein
MVDQLEWQHNSPSLPRTKRRAQSEPANRRGLHANPYRALIRYASMRVMLRFLSHLVIIALLATPLALLARGIACAPSDCNCAMAELASHSAAQNQHLCGATKHVPMCGTHPGHHPLDYGVIAPIAPTAPLPYAQLTRPAISAEIIAQYAQSTVAGVFSIPFEPPRS